MKKNDDFVPGGILSVLVSSYYLVICPLGLHESGVKFVGSGGMIE